MYDCDLARTITDAQRCGSVVEIRSRARRRNCGSCAYRATHWLASVVLVLTLADLPWSRGVARAQQVIYHEESLFANSKTFKYPSRNDLEEFGVEHIYNAAPMGMHQPWLIMGQTYGSRRNALLKNCPELQLIWSPGQHRGGSSISRARETRESAINRAKQQASHVAFIRQRHKKMIINRAKYRNLPRKYQRIRG